jgi:hypothetical protein
MLSRGNVALVVSWVVMAVVLALSVALRVSFTGGLELVVVAFFVVSALLGSRLWLALSHPRHTASDGP